MNRLGFASIAGLGMAFGVVACSGDREAPPRFAQTSSAIAGRDLVPTLAGGPHSAEPGWPFEVESVVCNHGDTPVEPSIAQIYLSPSPNLLLGYFMEWRYVPELAPSQCHYARTTISDTSWLPQGHYFPGIIADPFDQIPEGDETNNLLAGPVMGLGWQSDLVVTSITGPPSAEIGATITVETTVCNYGTQPSIGPVRVNIYSSEDAMIDGVMQTPPSSPDTILGTIEFFETFYREQCRTKSGPVYAYPGAPYTDGAYHLGAIVDEEEYVGELVEFNNERTGLKFGLGAASDLVITSVTGPHAAAPYDSFDLGAEVCNQGTRPSGPVYVAFYLSEDTVIEPGPDGSAGLLLTGGGLDAGECRSISGPGYAYAGSPYTDGPYYLGAIADDLHFENELVETNNTRAGGMMAIGTGPDLVLTAVTGPASVLHGETVTVEAEVCNRGTMSSGPAAVHIYASWDQTIEGVYQTPWPTDDYLTGTISTAAGLAPGDCERASGQLAFFAGFPWAAQAIYLGAIADEQNQIPEIVETNNELTGALFGLGDAPDLIISSLEGPPSAEFGQTIEVSARVCNQGTRSAGPAAVRLYFSADQEIRSPVQTLWPTEDAFAGMITTPGPLAPGQCRIASGPVSANPGEPYLEGPQYLGAIVDEQSFETELIETNNQLIGPRVGLGHRPDFVITALTGPASASFGAQIAVSAVICNQGTQPTGPTNVRVYFSSDQTLTPGSTDDFFAGTISTPGGGMMPGQCRTISGPASAHPGAPHSPGAYYLGAIADEPNFEAELDETNNEFIGALVGLGDGPDLVLTSIEGPRGAIPGQSITVTARVCNRGTQPAATALVDVYLSSARIGAISTLEPLSAGQCRTASGPLVASVGAEGGYELRGIVDELGLEPELNEANNSLAGAAIAIGNGPDLVITALHGPASATPGQVVTVEAVICNHGQATFSQAYANIYLSADATIDGHFQTPWPSDDFFAGSLVTANNLQSGECDIAFGSVQIQSGAPYVDGAYYLGAIADEQNFIPELIETNNEFVGQSLGIGGAPDLVVAELSGPPSAEFGAPMQISALICNRGTNSAGPAVVRVYLSADAQLDGAFETPWPSDDGFAGTLNTPGPLAAGQCRIAAGEVYASPGAPYLEGVQYLGAIVDEQNFEAELIETNNELTGPRVGVGYRPDLRITSLTGPASTGAGQQIEVGAVVCNQGTQWAGSAQIRIYFSADQNIEGTIETPWPSDDFFAGTISSGDLMAGQCGRVSGAVSAYPGAPYSEGAYYLGAIADEPNFQVELDETNNEYLGPRVGIGDAPDLIVTSIAGPSGATIGQAIDVEAIVCNRGTQPAAPAQINLYLSADTEIEGQLQTPFPNDDSFIGVITTAEPLAAGQCRPASGVAVAFPVAPSGAGGYYLGAIADEPNYELELDELNNELTGAQLAIGSGPDLIVTEINAPAGATPGGQITVEAVVCNRGTIDAPAAAVNIYVSADAHIDGAHQTPWPSDDALAGSIFTSGGVQAGRCETAVGPIGVYFGAPYIEGPYYLGAIADELDAISELIETNNEFLGPAIGIGDLPDLIVTSITGPPSAEFGQSIDVAATVCNQGTRQAGPVAVRVYLSADPVIEGTFETAWPSPDGPAGTLHTTGPLAAGQCRTAAGEVYANPGAPFMEGSQYLGAIVDEVNLEPELVETNNELAGGRIGLGNLPDLVITSISAPRSAEAGEQIIVTFEVCNQGTQWVSPAQVQVYFSADEVIEGMIETPWPSDDFFAGIVSTSGGMMPGQCRSASGPVAAYPGAPYFEGAYYLGGIADEPNFLAELDELNNEFLGARVGIGQRPDLVIASITATEGASLGQPITVTALVCNHGTQPAGPAQVNVYFSDDAQLESWSEMPAGGGDFLAGWMSITEPLWPGQCRSATGPIAVLPSEAGGYYLGGVVDEPNFQLELDEFNNERIAALTAIGPGPDLVVTSIAAPSSATAGQQVTVEAVLCNRGTLPAGSAAVQIYVSADQVIDGIFQTPWPSDDFLAGTLQAPIGVQAGACATVSGPVDIYPAAPFLYGRYHLGAIADEHDVIVELIESNNEFTGPELGIGDLPDLVVASIAGPPSAEFGQPIEVSARVCNRGTQAAGPTDVRVYLSADPVIEGTFETPWAEDGFAGTLTSGGPLAAGQCRIAAGLLNAAPGAPYFQGLYYLGAIVDEQDSQYELIETNNELIGGRIGLGGGADLVIRSISGPPSALPGQPITISASVCNQGTQAAGFASVHVYFSADQTIDGALQTPWPSDDFFAGVISPSGGGFLPGQCRTASGQVTAYPGAPYSEGAYYLGGIVDEFGVELELDETNNELTGARVGIGAGPDLEITSIGAPPGATPGQPIDVAVVVCNRGTAPSGPAFVNLYSSADPVIDGHIQTPFPGEDALLGSVTTGGPVSAGRCRTASGQVWAQPAAPYGGGGYYLGAIVDEPGFEPELDESNNEHTGALMAIGDGPDLVITGISAPPSATLGQPIDVEVTVCNYGTQPTGPSAVNMYVSADQVIDGIFQTSWPSDDFFAGIVTTPVGVAAGACETASGQIQASFGAPYLQGRYYLGAIADEGAQVFELIETNNEFTGPELGIGNASDLVITAISGPPSADFWQSITVEATVCNQGTLPASPVPVHIYLSADPIIEGNLETPWPSDDGFAGSLVPTGPLAPGDCQELSGQVNANSGVPYTPGPYYLGAIADELDYEPELIETNNELTGGLIGLGSGPDLVVTAAGGPPFVTPNGSYEVTSTVCNLGTASSPSGSVGIYLSADDQIDGELFDGDPLVASRAVPPLAPMDCSTETTPAFWTGNLPEGSYRVGGVADEVETIAELIEVNNTFAGEAVVIASVFCGNGAVDQPSEACDDGNFDSGDGCTASCADEYCGDGLINDGGTEPCDDGNSVSGDGCSASCQEEYCGDGAVNDAGAEACDDGNSVSGDGCTASCQEEYCGDGAVNDAGAEACDDGNSVSGDGCSASCQEEYCGDGAINDGGTEQCDDGNSVSGDGCSATCQTELITSEPWRENANGAQTINVVWNFAMGYHFTPQANGQVTALGGFFNGTKIVRLYDRGSGALLAETTVTAANTWSYTAITPVAVTAGTGYTVAVYLAGSGGSYRSSIQTLPRVYGNVRIDGSTYVATSASNPYPRPTNSTTTYMYGQADIRFLGPPTAPPPAGQATYDSTLRAPRCSAVQNLCDTGGLVDGRGPVGPEPNYPNTLGATCADSASGSYHMDESLDRLRAFTLDGTNFAPGKTVRVEATVWAWSTGSSDYLDLYYATNPSSPTWVHIVSRAGTAGGAITLSGDFVLPAGATSIAVRGQWRYSGGLTNPGPCASNSYTDRDDLVFAVGP